MPATLLGYLIVFLGAGIGGAMRRGVNIASLRLLGGDYPYNTLIVNMPDAWSWDC